LGELLDSADIISLHVPLDDSTRKIIGNREIDRMKPGTILINTCRGGVIDEKAVYNALLSGHLYGHGIDVFEDEPPQFLDLLRHENVVSSPHVAGISEDGLINMASLSAGKVIQFLNNSTIPDNVLNPGVLKRIKT
jgi:phosphoglycerate dehydrogenase-like enzyme